MYHGKDAKWGRPTVEPDALDLAERLAHAACREHDANHGGSTAPPKIVADYEIVHELGRGGQGTVYLALDRRLRREVALKILPWSTGTAEKRRLQREAEITARLDLPEVCKIFEFGRFEGGAYVAMQHVVGETVSLRIRAANGGGPVDLLSRPHPAELPVRQRIDTVLAFVSKAARAVHRVHLEGVVHRDLKPANLMLTPEGEPVILDFGLARADEHGLETLTATGDVFGTPAYMAPELLGDTPRPADRGSDIWALGCILWELLFARRPFDGPTRLALLEAIRSRPLPAGSRLLPGLAPELEAILQTALERDVARRYATAGDLADDLDRVVARRPVRARKGSWLLRARRFVQRSPLRVAAATLTVLLVTVTPTAVAVQARLAEAEIRDQQQRTARVARLAFDAIGDTLVELGNSALARIPGEVERRRKVLLRAQQLLADLEGEPTIAALAPAERLKIHFALGRLGEGTRRSEDAVRHMRRVLELFERHPNLQLPSSQRRFVERTARTWLATGLLRQGDTEGALRELDAAAASPALRDDPLSKADLHLQRAGVAKTQRDWSGSLAHTDAALRVLRVESTGAASPDDQETHLRAQALTYRGEVLSRLDRLPEAIDALDAAVGWTDAHPIERTDFRRRLHQATTLQARATLLGKLGRSDASLADIERVVAIEQDLGSLVPNHPDYRFLEAQARSLRIELLEQAGDSVAARGDIRPTFEFLDEGSERFLESPYLSMATVVVMRRLASAAKRLLPEEPELRPRILAAACAVGFAALKRSPGHPELLHFLSPVVRIHAAVLRDQGSPATAAAELRRIADLLQQRFGESTDVVTATERFRVLRDLGYRVTDLGDWDASRTTWLDALVFARRATDEDPASDSNAQGPWVALRESLEASFELERWDDVTAASAEPMRYFSEYISTYSGRSAAKRWLQHPLYTGSKRFLEPCDPEQWLLRLRLAAAVHTLHSKLTTDPAAKGAAWKRTRDRLRQRWVGLLGAAGRDLLGSFR